jgi:hypothetical protein
MKHVSVELRLLTDPGTKYVPCLRVECSGNTLPIVPCRRATLLGNPESLQIPH